MAPSAPNADTCVDGKRYAKQTVPEQIDSNHPVAPLTQCLVVFENERKEGEKKQETRGEETGDAKVLGAESDVLIRTCI